MDNAIIGGIDRETRDAIVDFLALESELLDDGHFNEWIKLVDERIRYSIPVRTTRMRGEASDIDAQGHVDDLFPALASRIRRMASRYNWAENPPSRTRHHVSNIRISTINSEISGEDHFQVRTNLLFFRSRIDDPSYDLISCERHDVIVRRASGLKLLQRRVILDHTTLNTHNLAFLL